MGSIERLTSKNKQNLEEYEKKQNLGKIEAK
jgi:hypothetical protein